MKLLSHSQSIIFWTVAIIILSLYNLTPALNSFDTEYYILAGQNILDGKIDCLRTPVYPLLCQAFIKLFGVSGMAITMTVFQSIIYLVSLVSTDLVLSYVYKPSIAKSIALHLFLLLLVFLRPTFIIFFAILPVVWLFHRTLFKHKTISFALTIICILCYGAYCSAYKDVYERFGSSATLVFNKIYDAHRGGYWDPSSVTDPESKKWIEYIDKNYTGNYGLFYNTFMDHPESMVPISNGCDEIIQAHKSEWQQYRIRLFASSCDKRMLAAVNTHTPLSSALFFSSLFLSFPVSLFYLISIIAVIALLVYFIYNKTIPIGHFLIIAAIIAYTVGIVLYTSDSHERSLLPVYPLFVILLGSAFEKATQFFRLN